jgi:predicted metalloprotease with PDZ domain
VRRVPLQIASSRYDGYGRRVNVFFHASATLIMATVVAANASPGPQGLAPPPSLPAPADRPYPGTLKLSVDVTDLDRRVVKVHEDIPVTSAGDLVLFYPRWLPGTHAPEGPIDRLAGLVIQSKGASLAWVRDPGDVFAFHVPVPAGATTVSIDFHYLSPVHRGVGRTEIGRDVLALDWNAVVLYPAGYFVRQIPVEATIVVPDGWRSASALEPASAAGARTTFKPVSVETLVDSPLHAGRYYARYDLAPGDKTPVALDLMADRADLVALSPAIVDRYRALVQQAYRLFGGKHYNHYDFLVALSDEVSGDTTLEHHRSAEYGEPVNDFVDWDKTASERDVFAHEYVHSWDGKFRRPADLWTPDFQAAMRNSLLWVYEGGTQYWGTVLTARAELWTKQQTLDSLAMMVAGLQRNAGRSWRPLADTTNDEIINPRRPMSWPTWQRFEDYYSEGAMIWLDADTLIREKTGGAKSLDDFARAFFGIEDGSYVPVAYTFDDVVKTLNAVYPNDWATFLRSRLEAHTGGPPLDGLRRGGYRLVFTAEPSEIWRSEEETRTHNVDHSYSLGLIVDKDNVVSFVAWDSPAAKAGVTAGMKILAVDGLAYEADRLKKSIQRAAGAKSPIELIVQLDQRFRTLRVDYHGGLRYPHLERDPSRPAMLDDILAPRAR